MVYRWDFNNQYFMLKVFFLFVNGGFRAFVCHLYVMKLITTVFFKNFEFKWASFLVTTILLLWTEVGMSDH